MKVGDHVLVRKNGEAEPAHAIVISLAEEGDSMAVTLVPGDRHIYARRESDSARWIDGDGGVMEIDDWPVAG